MVNYLVGLVKACSFYLLLCLNYINITEEEKIDEKMDRKHSRGERTSSELALDITQSSHSNPTVGVPLPLMLSNELAR